MNYECSLFYGPYFYDDVSDFFFTENLINDGLTFFLAFVYCFEKTKLLNCPVNFYLKESILILLQVTYKNGIHVLQ